MINMLVNIQCSSSAGPGVPYLVDEAQNSGTGNIPRRAISCFTGEHMRECTVDARRRRNQNNLPLEAAKVSDMMLPVDDIARKTFAAVRALSD
jgi:hypothetical protein